MYHEASAQVELHRTLWDSLLVPRRFLWKVRPEDAWKLAAEDPDVAPPLVVRRSRRYACHLAPKTASGPFARFSGALWAALGCSALSFAASAALRAAKRVLAR